MTDLMAEKNFRSEEEQIRSLLDEDINYPLLSSEDPIIFHNEAYEKQLLMSYNINFDNWSPMPEVSEPKKEEPDSDYTSGPLHLTPKVSKSRYEPYVQSVKPVPSATRKCKTGSNSKMADYARRYRAAKKQELASAEYRMQELENELKMVKEERARMSEALQNANSEIRRLKDVIDKDSSIAKVVADRFAFPGQLANLSTGVCLHIGSSDTTIEICSSCARSSEEKAASKMTNSDMESFDLFNGDFSSIEQFIH